MALNTNSTSPESLFEGDNPTRLMSSAITKGRLNTCGIYKDINTHVSIFLYLLPPLSSCHDHLYPAAWTPEIESDMSALLKQAYALYVKTFIIPIQEGHFNTMFEFHDELGQGSFATVYRYRAQSTNLM